MDITEILAHYETQSQDPKNVEYSPFFCALYDGDLSHVQELLTHYQLKGTIEKNLNFIGPQTNENILQVAMRHPEVIKLCCQVIEKSDKNLFTKLIEHTDLDGDTVFHQIVEFGRDKSLSELQSFLKEHVDEEVLREVYDKTNKYGETASDILENYDGSKTIQNLAVDSETKSEARENLEQVEKAFKAFELFDLPHSHKFGM